MMIMIEGKINKAMGMIILTGALCASSSARWRHRQDKAYGEKRCSIDRPRIPSQFQSSGCILYGFLWGKPGREFTDPADHRDDDTLTKWLG